MSYGKYDRKVLIERRVLTGSVLQPSIVIPVGIRSRAYRYYGVMQAVASSVGTFHIYPSALSTGCAYGQQSTNFTGMATDNTGLGLVQGATINYAIANWSLEAQLGPVGRSFISDYICFTTPPTPIFHGTMRGNCSQASAITSIDFSCNSGGANFLATSVFEVWAELTN